MLRTSLAAALLLLFAACEDPGNVGAGLIDEQSGAPERREFPPTDFEDLDRADLTGGSARILVGSVNDPDLGSIQAVGHFDFSVSFGVSEAFRETPLTSAAMVIYRTYEYGDTTTAQSFSLYDLEDEWSMTGRRADTTLARGAFIGSYVLPAGQDSVVAELPSDWIARQDTTIRSTSFESAFHGFALVNSSVGLISGFGIQNSRLILGGAETLRFVASRSLTTITFDDQAVVPPGTRLLQDGRGAGVLLRFDISPESLGTVILNGGNLVVPVDTTLGATAPFNFARPVLDRLEMYVVASDGSELLIETALRDADRFLFDDPNTVGVFSLLAKGGSATDHLELRVPSGTNSLDAILLSDDGDDASPEAVLLVTPVD